MSSVPLQTVADAVLRLAKRQGYVLPRDIRAELHLVGAPQQQWKDVLALARSSLVYHQGRYYLKESYSPRLQKEHAQQYAVQKAIRRLIKQHRAQTKPHERRDQLRVVFIYPINIRTEEGKEHHLLSRDLSTTGIRLIGTKRLLGQKVAIDLPAGEGQVPYRLSVRILWTCSVGDDLYENGGSFLEVLPNLAHESGRNHDQR